MKYECVCGLSNKKYMMGSCRELKCDEKRRGGADGDEHEIENIYVYEKNDIVDTRI